MTTSLSDLDTGRISVEAIREAANALNGVVTRTPLLENIDVNARLGGRLLIKAEHAQRTGAFKIRGAYNRLRFMTPEERRRGTITYSSGNHAQGLALAAQLMKTSALIVMPADVPTAKVESTKALGASVITFDRDKSDSNEVVSRLKEETGRIIVPPSGDVRILAGAGTAALELFQQSQDVDATLDAVLVPCGGGGLTAATAFLMHELSPGTRVFAVEPERFDDTRRSLEAGERVSNPKGQKTICDSIMTPTPNEHTFEINRRLLAGGLTASDDDVRTAMRFAYETFKIVVEPGAAIGIAAILTGQIDVTGKTIGLFTTGGNVDPHRYCQLLMSSGDLS
ncbi:MAG: threonine/serine dehydratase [Pseudomonadota bacterium]